MRTPLEFPSFLTFLALLLAICQVSATPARRDPNLLFERSAGTLASPRDTSPVRDLLVKRDCKYNGCFCTPETAQGQYCYFCYLIVDPGDTSVWPGDYTHWVYECNPNGGCCAYGHRTSCDTSDPTVVSPCGPTTVAAS
ncbi:hypothetical protein BDD12DRAFT_810069 [Trichophaea hybrida]|nr:hypothetical protein BDD12DRAFT_810069 [Trichophaea hybrida]